MPETGTSGSMSGDGKRSDGQRPQVTAPILDSTSGYYNGKRSNTVLDVNALLDYVSKVEDYCLHNQDVMVMKAAETLLGVSK